MWSYESIIKREPAGEAVDFPLFDFSRIGVESDVTLFCALGSRDLRDFLLAIIHGPNLLGSLPEVEVEVAVPNSFPKFDGVPSAFFFIWQDNDVCPIKPHVKQTFGNPSYSTNYHLSPKRNLENKGFARSSSTTTLTK
ncbi:hypothetical protein Sjap_013089 [Stephania japonica]|uniref:Uncharacterized protein n=1 Tax=Stephania japonica TaxID=461633 RepID=A0AAP0NXD0_9MAGN